jgi:hypothetical protein
VATPTTTLLLGYVIAKFYSRKTDIENLRQIESLREELKSLREQNTGSGEGDVSVKK